MFKFFKSTRKYKIIAVGLALVLCVVALVAGCGREKTAQGPVKVYAGWSPSACGAPIFVAYEKGFFKDEGLDVEMVQVDAAHISEAVGAGKVDFCNGLIGKLIKPLENGLPMKEVSGLHRGCQKMLVPADSPIKTVADLKGKKIGIAGMMDAGTIIARRAMNMVGIDATEHSTDFEFAVFDRQDLPQALATNKVDAIIFGDPQATIAEEQYGWRVLIDTAKTAPFGDEYCCALFISDKLISSDPDTAAKITRAVQRASKWVQERPQEAAQLEIDHKYVAGDVSLINKLLQSYNYTPSVQGGYDALLKSVQDLNSIGLMKQNTDAKKFTDEHTAFFKDFPDCSVD